MITVKLEMVVVAVHSVTQDFCRSDLLMKPVGRCQTIIYYWITFLLNNMSKLFCY